MMIDILGKLKNLHVQAMRTPERLHFDVASCCEEAIAEILKLRTKIFVLQTEVTRLEKQNR